ncbi:MULTISPECIES: hypothetical protein [Acinetobacter calcoaceticus/baumannii complex]|uniref:hypothetical protein n=1 Tax=Acinetobacter calcoaceticus/baumannii complex TaxID=909768 RepID=UPI0039F65193
MYIKKSWTRFVLTPWIFIAIITFFSLGINYFNINTNNSYLFYFIAFFVVITLILLPYSMLTTAPSKPYLSSVLYMFLIWLIIKIINIKDLSLNDSLYTGLISGIISTLIAMAIFYFRGKKIKTY